ncbi:Glutathione S-transferase T1-like protein [Drosera capensis]
MEDLSCSKAMRFLFTWLALSPELQITVTYVRDKVLAPNLGLPINPQSAAEAKKLMDSSLSKIESVWLKGNGKFLLGSHQPSVADLSLVCEIMQLEVLEDKDRNEILGPYKKVQQWIEATKDVTKPHFNEVHGILVKAKKRFEQKRLLGRTETVAKDPLQSKL